MFGFAQFKLLAIVAGIFLTLGSAGMYRMMDRQAERRDASARAAMLAGAVKDRDDVIQAHKDAAEFREAAITVQRSSTAYDQAALDMIERKNMELRDALAKAEAEKSEPVVGFQFPDRWLRERPRAAASANQTGRPVAGAVPAR
jgi:hypothetical protein